MGLYVALANQELTSIGSNQYDSLVLSAGQFQFALRHFPRSAPAQPALRHVIGSHDDAREIALVQTAVKLNHPLVPLDQVVERTQVRSTINKMKDSKVVSLMKTYALRRPRSNRLTYQLPNGAEVGTGSARSVLGRPRSF